MIHILVLSPSKVCLNSHSPTLFSIMLSVQVHNVFQSQTLNSLHQLNFSITFLFFIEQRPDLMSLFFCLFSDLSLHIQHLHKSIRNHNSTKIITRSYSVRPSDVIALTLRQPHLHSMTVPWPVNLDSNGVH